MRVPALRFKDDFGHVFPDWRLKNIGDVLSIGSGKDYKHLLSGVIPVYGTGGYMLSVNDYLYDGESVCIGRKGTIDKPVLLNGKFWTVDTLFYTHSFKNCIPKFIYAAFQRIDWKNYNEASGVPSLSKSTIAKIEISLPSIAEQNKIANFLKAIDEKITQLTQKHDLLTQYKKGVMQQVFSQKLRFKDDDGRDFPDWEVHALADLSDVRDGTHDSPKFYSKGYPLITSKNLLDSGQLDLENVNLISEEDFKKINKRSNVEYGDILFGMIGTIGNPVVVKSSSFAIKNVALIKQQDKLKNDYLSQYLKSSIVLKQFGNITVGNSQKFIALGKLRQLKIELPSKSEQTKIANFLTAIDDKITTTKAQLDAVKQYKQGLLQQMFV